MDEFVLYDEVQYTTRDWRNRNRIKTAQGWHWLTIPVVSGARERSICEVEIADPSWAASHWKTLCYAYGETSWFDWCAAELEPVYCSLKEKLLSQINYHLLCAVNRLLGIDTPISWSSAYPGSGDKNGRLLAICLAAGAERYLSGPAAQGYLDVSRFSDAGVAVEWIDYGGYPEYRQNHPPFEHGVSVLDLLVHKGPESRSFMKIGKRS